MKRGSSQGQARRLLGAVRVSDQYSLPGPLGMPSSDKSVWRSLAVNGERVPLVPELGKVKPTVVPDGSSSAVSPCEEASLDCA